MSTRYLTPRTGQAVAVPVRQADHTRHHFVGGRQLGIDRTHPALDGNEHT